MRGACERRYRPDARLGEAIGGLAIRLVAICLVGLSLSACSLSYAIVSFSEDDPETTASIAPKAAASPLSPDLNEEDWRRAKAALAVALDPQGAGTQVSWDNPETTRKGSFVPSGAPFVKNDEICRAFIAHIVVDAASSLHGTACRPSGGEWLIKEIKPAGADPESETDFKASSVAKPMRKA